MPDPAARADLAGRESTPDQATVLRTLVAKERQAARAHLESLNRTLSDLIGATDLANVDDEHDPEGNTIAFDRAQIASLLESVQLHLDALDRADARIEMGSAGICESCGGEIAPARLMAIPTATQCIACAALESTDSRGD
jgi:RNA polymerase-binding transcription factor DksA